MQAGILEFASLPFNGVFLKENVWAFRGDKKDKP